MLAVIVLIGVVALIASLFVRQLFESERLDPQWLAERGAILFEKPQTLELGGIVDDSGTPFSPERLLGGWSLMFFGYTHCPDFCPTTMAVLKQMFTRKPELADTISVFMVSLDPERDSPEKLSAYLDFFSPDFVGLTGDPEHVAAFAASAHIAYQKVVDAARPNDYLLDHSAQLILVDDKGRYSGYLKPPFEANALGETLAAIVATY